jgi:hypothetical protein
MAVYFLIACKNLENSYLTLDDKALSSLRDMI